MRDGKIARKYNLVTDFGKFLDPLADKFMVIGAMLCILFTNAGNLYMFTLYFFALVVVVFRELAVTSIRLVAASGKEKVVIAANMLGKIKTVTQIVAIVAAIIEPLIYSSLSLDVKLLGFPPITLVTTALMIYLTIHSGINYIVGAWKYLDPQK
jgi:CDP-diacylglycerol--glycerol-3-phosphate 3-phosphatidyltransferase